MNRHTPGLNAIAARYPTPTVQDGENCGGPSQLNRHSVALNVLAKFPTPRDSSLCGGTGAFAKLRALADAGEITEEERAAAARSFQTYDTPTVHGDGGSGRKGNMPAFAQLNPDWVEWLMGWPVGWTDITRDECDWRDISNDPSDIHIATTRRDNRPARIKAIGNGQVPLCAAVAAESGFAFLEAIHEIQAASAATARGGLPATPGAGLPDLADGFDRAGGHFPSSTVTE